MNETINLMMHQASQALQHAYAPYSKFTVAACLSSESDELFTGVNVENSSYGLTVCAETSAICQMISAGQHQIKNIVILTADQSLCPPCGACRQRIFEFSNSESRIYLCNKTTVLKIMTMDEALPFAFNFTPS